MSVEHPIKPEAKTARPGIEFYAHESGADKFVRITEATRITEVDDFRAGDLREWQTSTTYFDEVEEANLRVRGGAVEVAIERPDGTVLYFPDVTVQRGGLAAVAYELTRPVENGPFVVKDVKQQRGEGILVLEPGETLLKSLFVQVDTLPQSAVWLREEPPATQRLGEYWDAKAAYEQVGIPVPSQRQASMGTAAVTGSGVMARISRFLGL